MGCKQSTPAQAKKDAVQGTPAGETVVGEAVLGTKVYTDMGTGVVGAVKQYEDTQIMVIQMDLAGTMSCPLDRLDEMRKPKGAASPKAASAEPEVAHPAIGTKVLTDMGPGVVEEVKTYEDSPIMVIKMDVAGTMSCPLDRLEEMTKPLAAGVPCTAHAEVAEVAEAAEPAAATEETTEPAAEEVKVDGCFGWCRTEATVRTDDMTLGPGPMDAVAEVA